MKKVNPQFFILLQLPLDYLAVVLAGVSAYLLRISPWIVQWRPVLFQMDLPFLSFLKLDLLVSSLWIIFFALAGLYRSRRRNYYFEESFQIAAASSLGFLSIVIYIFIQQQWFNSRFILLVGWFLSIIFVWLERVIFRWIRIILARRFGIGKQNIIVIDNSDSKSQKFLSELGRDPFYRSSSIKIITEADLDRVRNIIQKDGIDSVILSNPNIPRENFLGLINLCEDEKIDFKFVPNFFQTLTSNTDFAFVGPFPLVELRQTALNEWGRVVKRIIDLLGSFLGLIFVSPIFILIGILIKFDSPGPILVKLKRISQDNPFFIYKFRSMIENAEEYKKYLLPFNERKDSPFFKMKNDPRVTRIGRFLRRTRFDELPQLINVFRGEMSLVGPRPHQPDEIDHYRRKHRKVLNIKPGMTGLAQISGSSDLPFEEEIKLDTYYMENWSLWLDFKILIKTFLIVFKDKSAC